MNRQGWVAIAIAVVLSAVIALWLLFLSAPKPEADEPAPDPLATTEPMPEPTATVSPTPTPDVTGDPDAHTHTHGHGQPEDCETGPLSCDPKNERVEISQTDLDASMVVRPGMLAFLTQWLTVTPDEDSGARAERLRAAGATDDLAVQMTRVARAGSSHIGLSAEAKPQSKMMALLLGREDGLLRFRVAVNVDAFYAIAAGSQSFHVAGGTVNVWVDDAGTVHKIEESFPTIEALR